MTITPEQARELLDGATPGPWMLNPHGCILVDDGTDDPPGPHGFIGTMWKNGHPDEEANGLLIAASPDLAQTIAGMRWEYGVEHLGHVSPWGSRESAEDDLRYYLRTSMFIPHLVRRLVGPAEVTE